VSGGVTPSKSWLLLLDLTGYQTSTQIAVWLEEAALGVYPPNVASRVLEYLYVPLTAASNRSVLSCETGLEPVSSIRRGVTVPCYLSLIDAHGDPLKGVVGQFVVHVDGGSTTELVPSVDGWSAVFSFTPPPHGDDVTLTVLSLATNATLESGGTLLDVADSPDETSTLWCNGGTSLSGFAMGNTNIQCSITVRNRGLSVKGIPSDFQIFAMNTGLGNSSVAPVIVMEGGRLLLFNVSVPQLPTLIVHPHDVPTELAVRVLVAGGSHIGNGEIQFDVVHIAEGSASVLECSRVQRFDSNLAPETYSYDPGHPANDTLRSLDVASHETVVCDVWPRVHGAVPVKALPEHVLVVATEGYMSSVVSLEAGFKLRFW